MEPADVAEVLEESEAVTLAAPGGEGTSDSIESEPAQSTPPSAGAPAMAFFAEDVEWAVLGTDEDLAAEKKARLEITVYEGQRGVPLVNVPLRIDPTVFRLGRELPDAVRTDRDGKVTLDVFADEGLRILVLEEFRNVPLLERRTGVIPAGRVAKMEIVIPLPPMVEMWVRVVSDATGEPVEDVRVWLERKIHVGEETLLEPIVEERTDGGGIARLYWPDAPPLGGRAEHDAHGVARFVPVKDRGTEEAPFELRLAPAVPRGNFGALEER